MAITNARMQIKRGNEVDFDSEKMLVGEWALSTDKRIVRICVAPNVCIRMATYDAFEVDMAKVEKILEECQTIEDAVELINSQVSDKLNATIEYTNQAKQYRDEAKTFRDEAEQFAPDGYVELQKTVASNTAKIDTIIEKAELNIKNTASGENLHLTDSADSKAVSFNLYGKAEQKQYSGKNLLQNTAIDSTSNGITFTVNENGSITANGTATNSAYCVVAQSVPLSKGEYILSGCPSGGSSSVYSLYIDNVANDFGQGRSFVVSDATEYKVIITIIAGQTVNNLTFYPMIRLASITDATFEPYVGGIPSPNPDYPQDITVSGSDGSVEVKSVGKNLLKNTLTSYTVGNVVFATNEDGTVNVNGQTSDVASSSPSLCDMELTEGSKYILSGGVSSSVRLFIYYKEDYTKLNVYSNGNDASFTVPITGIYRVYIRVYENTTVANALVKPMIRLASDTDSTYEPYTETTSTIPTQNGLCGIKVSSGGNYTDENGQMWICDEIVKYADGSGKRVQRCAMETFNGSENWGIDAYENLTVALNQPLLLANETTIISNVVKTTSFNKRNDFTIPIAWVHANNGVLYVRNTGFSLSEWKTYLSENQCDIIYILAEPIITDLTAEEIAEIEKLYTFYPVTNISNDADCGMAITYMADAKRYIDQRLALIEKAMINNI